MADYQADSIYHGLKSVWGTDVECTTDLWYLYETLQTSEKSSLYGLGFTLYGLLPTSLKRVPTLDETIHKIKLKYYDFIIFGSIRRSKILLPLVCENYLNNKIIFIDGEDNQSIDKKLLNKGIYFKRELTDITYTKIYPIGFSIPKSKIINNIPHKIREWSLNVPGKLYTYIYQEEEAYYKDYQLSKFAMTTKKAGWDCMRHYEIIANGCLLYFKDIDYCPSNTLVQLPKDFLKKIKKKINDKSFTKDEYFDYTNYLLEYAKQKLTTEFTVENLIEVAKTNSATTTISIPNTKINQGPNTSTIPMAYNIKTTSESVGFIKSVNNVQIIRSVDFPYKKIYISSSFQSALSSLKKLILDNRIILVDDIHQVEDPLDFVILEHNLNYECNIIFYLNQVKQLLKDGAELRVVILNSFTIAHIRNFLKGQFNPSNIILTNRRAVNFFSKIGISNLITKLNFNIQEVKTSNFTSDRGARFSTYFPFVKSFFHKEIFISALNKTRSTL